MINKVNKERQRSMNATPKRSSNKCQWQGAQELLVITHQPTIAVTVKPPATELWASLPLLAPAGEVLMLF
jgi:hypothetical protein